LTDRTFSVHDRGLESAVHQIPAGLPQSVTLSPTLYGVFTCDPPELPKCDLAVFATSTSQLVFFLESSSSTTHQPQIDYSSDDNEDIKDSESEDSIQKLNQNKNQTVIPKQSQHS
jgi:hypothetical protein